MEELRQANLGGLFEASEGDKADFDAIGGCIGRGDGKQSLIGKPNKIIWNPKKKKIQSRITRLLRT